MPEYVHTVEIAAYDPGVPGAITLYYADNGFTSGTADTPANTFFDGRIVQPLNVRRSMFAPGTTSGRSQVGAGELVLANDDGVLDPLLTYGFDGRVITVRRGLAGAAYPSGFTTTFVATMEQVEAPEEGRLVVRVKDRQAELNIKLQTTLYAGDNALPAGLEGVAGDLKGKPKPLLYGVVRNISPPLVNTSRLIYQVNDGAINSLDEVYDSGIALGRTPSSWTSETSGTANALNGVAFADSLWVAVGDSGTIIKSSDGSSWSAAGTPSFGATNINALAYSPSLDLWVAVGDAGKAATSPDGNIWTQRTTNFGAENCTAVTWGKGDGTPVPHYVIVGDAGGMDTSTDGTTWTARTSSFGATPIRSLLSARNQFVAGGDSGKLAFSADGISWTQASTTAANAVRGLAFGDNAFIAGLAAAGVMVRSDKGVSWLDHSGTGDFIPFGVMFGGPTEEFIMAGVTSVFTNAILSSRDGQNWTMRLLDNAFAPAAIGASDTLVLIVGSGGKILSMDGSGTYASEADLLNDSLQPEPGTYKVYLAGGLFRLGSQPAGTVTCDATQGAAASDRTTTQLWTDVLLKAGKLAADWSAADVTALDSADASVVGLWTGTDEVRASEVLTKLASTVGAWWGPDQLGIYRIKQLIAATGSTALDIVETDLLRPLKLKPTPLPRYRSNLRYSKNYTPQKSGLAGGVSDVRRAALAEDWLKVTKLNASIQTTFLLAREVTEDSLYSVEANAQTEVDRRQVLHGVKRRLWELLIPLDDDTISVDIGNVVQVTHPRYSLSGGVKFIVFGLVPDADASTLLLTAWG